MDRVYDVVIVGAGPSGSSAARELAEAGCTTLLLERKSFPRPKPCAAWINALTFTRFPHLKGDLPELVESPFYGIRFYDEDLRRSNDFSSSRPAGYVTLRSVFDRKLAEIAVRAGVDLRQEARVCSVEEAKDGVRVKLDVGETFFGRFLVGADGTNSTVARHSGIRRAWKPDQYVLCGNEDIPCDPGRIERFYGRRFPVIVVPRFGGVGGYGWIFPKRRHICVGIGARLAPSDDIRELTRRFVAAARERGLLPAEIDLVRPDYAVDPAGAALKAGSLARGRIVLVGDAGGFVSGRTGEGIYPGMLSGAIAAEVIQEEFRRGSSELSSFNERWRRQLGTHLQSLPGGSRKSETASRIDMIFKSRIAAAVAGRMFLYGEPLGAGTLLRALWHR